MNTDEVVESEVITPEVNGEQTASPAEGTVATDVKVELTPDQIKAETAKRMDELLMQRKQATEEKQAAIKRAKELEARVNELENPVKKPDRLEYDSEEAYLEALVDYKAETRERVKRSETLKRESENFEVEQKATIATNHAKFLEKVAEAEKTIPDIKKALEDVYLDKDQVMLQVIHESPMGAELAYYLAKNEKTARDIALLSPLGIARELGKLELQIAADNKRKINSNAPQPITPVGSKGTAVKDYSTETAKQYAERVNAEELAKRR